MADLPVTPLPADRSIEARPFLFGLVLAALVLACGLGQDRLMRMDDEGLYVRIAIEMFARHDWTVPTWFGQPAWYKPPGLYWSMFPWFSLFGPTLLAGRVASLVWGVLAVAATVAFAWRASGRQAALLAGLLLLTCSSFFKYSRVGMMEAPLTFFYIAALYALYRAHVGDGPRWTFAFMTLMGASCLIKGPVTAIILTATALIFGGLQRRLSLWRTPAALAGAVVGAGFLLLWPLMVLSRGEWQAWWDFFIVRENLGKFDNMFYSPLNIWGMFLVHAAPWTFLLLGTLWTVVRQRRWTEPALLLNLVFMACLLTFFTLPATRLSWYSVPALPEAALLMGLVLSSGQATKGARQATAVLLLLVGAILLLALRVVDLSATWPWVVLSAAAAWLAAGSLLAGRVSQAAAAVVALYTGLAFVGCGWKYPFITPEARALLQAPNPVLVRLSPYDWSFEIGQLATQVTTEAEVAAWLQKGGTILISQSDLAEFEGAGLSPSQFQVATSWPVLRRNLPLSAVVQALRGGPADLVEEPMEVIRAH